MSASMNQTSARHLLWTVILSATLLIVGYALALPPGPSAGPEPAYQYTGVGQALVRIRLADGRIEILEQEHAAGATLVHRQAEPWTWREIPTRTASRKQQREKENHPGEARRTDR